MYKKNIQVNKKKKSQQIRLLYLEPVIPQSSRNYIQEYIKGSLASAEFVLSKPYTSILPEFFFY